MDPRLWSLIEGEPDDEVAVLARVKRGTAVPESVRVIARFEDIVSGRVPRGELLTVREDERIASLKAPLNLNPANRVDRRSRRRRDRGRRGTVKDDITGAGVCIGVIDWGFDFTHPNFLSDDGRTRLLALWDQRPHRTVGGL